MVVAEEVVSSTMDAAFDEKLKEGAEAFEFQAEVSAVAFKGCGKLLRRWCPVRPLS